MVPYTMDEGGKIYVAGHRGLVGSALVRRLQDTGYTTIITRSHAELDLTDRSAAESFFQVERPEYVFLAAARVGGIWANSTYGAEFIHTNLCIQTSVIHAAHLAGVKRLIFFGSNCAYPRDCPQPMDEAHLMSAYLERTSEPYAIAKIAGMRMCEAYNRQYGTEFLSVIPATLYGPNGDFDLRTSHVLSALVRRIHEARETQGEHVDIWGTGTPRREFLYVDDLADACILLMNLDAEVLQRTVAETGWVINVGTGEDLAILQLAELIKGVVGFEGKFTLDPSRPDGAARKLLNSQKIRDLGWSPGVSLRGGIEDTYRWYLDRQSKAAHGLRKATP